MVSETYEHNRIAEKRENKNTILPDIRTYIAAILLFTPSLQGKGESHQQVQQEVASWGYQETQYGQETSEYMVTYETIFKKGIQKALQNLNDLKQLPIGGKHIDYYRDEGSITGQKISLESMQVLKFPEKFDISPRDIIKPVVSMTLHLGNRKFEITPDVGKIKDIYLTPDKLVIQSTLLFDISYDKQMKLPDLMFRLWMTPLGKGEKKGFRGTTVMEI